MITHKRNKVAQLLPLLAIGTISVASAQSAVSVYISAPNTQTAEATNFGSVGTETPVYEFETEGFGYSTGAFNPSAGASPNTGIYTVTSGNVNVTDVEAYGGGVENATAGTTNQGNYLSVEKGGEVTITFAEPVDYFGFQWTAGNAGNTIEMYDALGNPLGYFDTGTVVGLLPKSGTTITAVDGVTTYNSADYYGLPGKRSTTPNEPYAYLHFINDGGFSISKIVLSHPSDGSGAFESDNHSVRKDAPVIGPGSEIAIVQEGIPLVPEPSTTLLGAVGCLILLRRRR